MSPSAFAVLLPLAVLIAGLILFLVVSNSQSRRRSDFDQYFRNDDRYWVFGVLYNNPNDPNVIVPKRYQGGLTLNLGHPLGRLLMFGTLVLVAVMIVLGTLSGSRH